MFFSISRPSYWFLYCYYLQQVFARSYADSVSEAVGGVVMAPGYVVEFRCVFNLNV